VIKRSYYFRLGAAPAAVGLSVLLGTYLLTPADTAVAGRSANVDVPSGYEVETIVPDIDMTHFEEIRSFQGTDRCLAENSILPRVHGDGLTHSIAVDDTAKEPARSLGIVRVELLTTLGYDVSGTTLKTGNTGSITGVRVNAVPGSQIAVESVEALAPSLSPDFAAALASLKNQGVAVTVAAVADQGFAAACPLWDSLATGTFWSDAGLVVNDVQASSSINETSGRLELSVPSGLIDRVELALVGYGDVATVDELLGRVDFQPGTGRMPVVVQQLER
jgi:hypothetical protein